MKKTVASVAVALMLGYTVAPGAFAQSSARSNVPDMSGKVITVNGPVDPDKLGDVLMHEHVFIDLNLPWKADARWKLAGRMHPKTATQVALYNAPLGIHNLGDVTLGAPNHDNLVLDDQALAIKELGYFRKAGGGTVVDLTGIDAHRQPEALQQVSLATDLNIVMGTGWQGAAWYPDDLATRSLDSLTDELVRDVTSGVEGTSVRAGIIGEIGISANPSEPLENRIIRAAARASRITGAALSIDASDTDRQQDRILDILDKEGADLSRVILGHTAYLPGDEDYLIALMKRGPTIEFDLLGETQTITRQRPLDSVVAKGIAKLVDAGYAKQILISQDVHSKTSLRAYGGTGYSYVESLLAPYLKKLGVTDAQIHTIIVDNPRRLLTFAAPRPD